jgi:MFS family permease
MGDMLLATVFPLVMRKAFGRAAGLASLVSNLGLIVALLTAAVISQSQVPFPVMVILGPLILLQYAYWRRRCGRERTIRQYLQIEPLQRTARART